VCVLWGNICELQTIQLLIGKETQTMMIYRKANETAGSECDEGNILNVCGKHQL